MKTRIIFPAALFVACLLPVSSAWAALVIESTDIADNRYSYSLSFADMATSTKFDADVFSQAGVSVGSDGTGAGERRYLRANAGLTSASFTYKFDFSEAGYAATSVSFGEYLLINNSSIAANESKTTTQWSVDGVEWTDVRTLTRTGSQSTGTSTGTISVDFAALVGSGALDALPETVYYRVTFTSLTGAFILNSQQWNRGGPDQTNFSANFTLAPIPEPSAFALLVGACGLVATCMRRRRGQRR